MCFFVFLKKPMSFDYSVNVFKKILKKCPRDRNYVKTPLTYTTSLHLPPKPRETTLFLSFLFARGGLPSSDAYMQHNIPVRPNFYGIWNILYTKSLYSFTG